MSFLDEIQKAGGILTEVKSVVDQGLDIFQTTKDTVFPTRSTSEGVPSPTTTTPATKTSGPIATPTTPSSSVSGGFLSGIDNKMLLVIGAAVIGFLILRK